MLLTQSLDLKNVMYALVSQFILNVAPIYQMDDMSCHAVFGWFQKSFTGVEQEDHHVVTAGYLKGAPEAQSHLAFTINKVILTGRFPLSGELNNTLF